KIKPLMEIYQWGLCVWNDETANFEPLKVLWEKSAKSPKPPRVPEGHPMKWKDAAGQDWILFGNPLPTLGCPAKFEAWQDPAKWQIFKAQEGFISAADRKAIKPNSGHVVWN